MEVEYEATETKNGVKISPRIKKRILDYSAYYLSAEEIKKLKETALSFGRNAPIYYAMICLMVNCGLRRSEVCNLRIEQINFDGNMVELGANTKTRIPRKIPFNDEVARALRLVVGDRKSGFVFVHRTGVLVNERLSYSTRSYTPVSINLVVAKIAKAAGISPKGGGMKNLNPHLLRHTWVKNCKEAGIPEDYVRVMGGWSSEKMIKRVYGVPTYDLISKSVREKMGW